MLNFASLREHLGFKPSASLYDAPLLYSVIFLIGVGFVMVTSASLPVAERLYNNPYHFSLRYGAFLLMAFLCFIPTTLIPMQWWKKANPYLLFVGLGLLVAVLLVGTTVNGSKRWIRFAGVGIQASEVAKLFFFSYLAGYLLRKREEVQENFKGFLKPLAVFIAYAGLILLQPDLGTVVVMFVTIVSLLFLVGAKLWQFLLLLLAGIALIGVLIVSAPYRWARMTGFLDPWDDAFGKGYQLVQSLMAYSQGSWLGQGLGNSVQKLQYLPEAHTDFIFAIIAEELGFIGVICVLVALAVLVSRALFIGYRALQCNKEYEGYFALAISVWFTSQILVNIGASAGILPTKGLTLPFVSHGGSSLIIMSIAVAILLRIDFEIKMATKQATSRSASGRGMRKIVTPQSQGANA